MSAAAHLAGRLAAAIRAIEEARAFEHDHRLTTRRTRKLPGDAIRSLRRWQEFTTAAAYGDTVNGTEATAPHTGSQAGEVKGSPSAKELPTVAIAPTVSIRVPTDLREQAEAYGRERRWTFGEVVRVGLEQLVDQHDQDQRHRQASHGTA